MAWHLDTSGEHAASSPRRWRVSGYADVRAALANPGLHIPGAPEAPLPPRERLSVHQSLPDGEAFAAHALALLTRALQHAADAVGVDLVSQVAMPFGAYVASASLGLPEQSVRQLLPHAGIVWQDAAMASMPDASSPAREATMAMVRADVPPEHLQALVALTHSLPALLGNVFAYLMQHPLPVTVWEQQARQVVEELLRVAGPARLVYRIVHHPPDAQHVHAQSGDVVAIDLHSANTDATVWSNPTHLVLGSGEINRVELPHVAFGWTPHVCVGARVIRRALTSMLEAWMHTFGADAALSTCAARERELVTMCAMQQVRVWRHAAEGMA